MSTDAADPTSTSSPTAVTSHARRAYETLEPLHILVYFNPGLGAAQERTGLEPYAFYVGARAAPMGECVSAVVTSAFMNFSPALIDAAWPKAIAYGLEGVSQARYDMLDEQLRAILGDRVEDPAIAQAAAVFAEAAAALPRSGRPLASAWAAAPAPTAPYLALWHHLAVLREWRGDNHIAALVEHGLGGLDAAVFHESRLPDPTVVRRTMGRRMVLLTRGYTDADWEAAVDRLVARGLTERGDSATPVLTATGAALYDDIEAITDAIGEPVWAEQKMIDTVTELRPYVKTIIDAGVLPGTKKRS